MVLPKMSSQYGQAEESKIRAEPVISSSVFTNRLLISKATVLIRFDLTSFFNNDKVAAISSAYDIF